MTPLSPAYHRRRIERTAQHILDVRARYPGHTLAQLYDPQAMPLDLWRAHRANDRAVDNAYIAAELAAGRPRPDLSTEAKRVAFLFGLYARGVQPGD